MSFSLQGLKSATDDKVPSFAVEPLDFTTTAIRRNLALENGIVGKELKVENNDSANSCTVRLHSRSGPARVVPPASDKTFREWFVEFHVEPNGTSGQGQIEIEAVNPEDARK